MAEKIVSPGVFTRERDLSFLPAAIGEIGAAMIGPTVKGPAFEPTIIESFKEFEAVFGPKSKETYLPYTVEQYLKSAGRVTIVRVLGLSGYTLTNGLCVVAANVGPTAAKVTKTVAAFHPSQVDDDAIFTVLSGSASDVTGSGFVFYLSGSSSEYAPATNQVVGITGNSIGTSTGFENITGAKIGATAYSMSLDPASAFYVTKVFGKTPKDRNKPVYSYVFFSNEASRSNASSATDAVTSVTARGRKTLPLSTVYAANLNEYEARTPFITSQKIGGKTTSLFKIHRRSHGSATNFEFKIAIDNIRAAGTVAGSDYGSFSMRLRRVDVDGTIHSQLSPFSSNGDKDRRPEIVEQWNNLTLDPDNPNFIARVIGDKYQAIDANGKVTIKGDYANLSRHIWVEVPEDIKDKGVSPDLVPFGYEAIIDPIKTLTNGVTNCPSSSIIGQTNSNVAKKTQILDNVYNKNVYYGIDYLDSDNHNYLKPLPSSGPSAGANVAFNLSNEKQHPSASLNAANTNETTITPGGSTINLSTKKFVVPFQGGFDGFNPSRFVGLDTNISAANMQGFDLSTAEKDGSLAYKRSINAVANPDEYDINLMVTPGANHRLHSVVTTHAKNTCEERGDAFYVMDAANYGDTIATVTNTVKAFDSNYAATYYPWVKILDTDLNKPVWVPPSVVVPGAIAYNDQVAFEWFAPAGLNRGSLTEVLETADRVTHEERDDLYEGRVNPIATFPGQGVCIWGQKTLQGKPSALDRVNVRRLLIAVKKFIASATRYLVFENNTSATRNRFLNIVNPYLESVQQRQGVYAFKVIMDATNNTPDVIDRNQMVGELFLQPAKAAEFIILDFNILPTGAAFPE